MATMLKASVQKLNPATTCVLVCDVQQRFTEIIFGFQELVKCSSYLVKVANALDLPVVCTEQYPKAFKQTVPELSTLIQQKDKNRTFEKTMFSMATPEVMSHLSSMGIESCVLCGLETHVCILQTTLDMLDNGLNVHIACDAVSSQRPFDRSVALKRLNDAGAVLSTSEAVVFQLLKDSKHPHFKSVAPFVRASGNKTMELYDRGPHDNLAPWIIPQVMLEIYCAGARGAILVSTSATRGAVLMRVERDEAYIASMLGFVDSFYERFCDPAAPADPGPCFNGGAAFDAFVARTGEIARAATVVERVETLQRAPPGDKFFLD